MTSRILFVDAYDSFTNNIISLLETRLNVEVTQVKIDSKIDDLGTFLRPFLAVIAGPGPGNPANDADVGLIKDLWGLEGPDLLPVLGICLGFQSLVLSFGGTIEALPQPRHGIETLVTASNKSIFTDIGDFYPVQYHSLHASLGHSHSEFFNCTEDLWTTTSACPDLEPLAWDLPSSGLYDERIPGNPENSCPILMAVKHRVKPFSGIQFHPESICSDAKAQMVIESWWSMATEWNKAHSRTYSVSDYHVNFCPTKGPYVPQPVEEVSYFPQMLKRYPDLGGADSPRISASSSIFYSTPPSSRSSSPPSSPSAPTLPLSPIIDNQHYGVVSKTCGLGDLNIPDICSLLGLCSDEAIVLDSEMRQTPEVATHSIIGIVLPDTVRIEYTAGSHHVRLLQGGETIVDDVRFHGGTIFTYLKEFMEKHAAKGSCADVPFWGGLMGYVTYEACLETIDIFPNGQSSNRPDIYFAFIERSIVIDHQRGLVYIQSIKSDDHTWLLESYEVLKNSKEGVCQGTSGSESMSQDDLIASAYLTSPISVNHPKESSYKAKIRACHRSIHKGDSYELCLTNKVSVQVDFSLTSTSWPLYLRLRRLNPAPFAAYLRLGPLTLLSTSPERFMSWSRPTSNSGQKFKSVCQFRPIKGTVRKNQITSSGVEHVVTLAEATSLLSTTKERAENLMIVDLIRHDLHGVVGSGKVQVRKLMVVEEYASLFQLVSVIEGTLELPSTALEKDRSNTEERKDKEEAKTGIDVLAASLPPGSMTGAPKRRSCQLLRAIEDNKPRSVYSGVLGYMCVGGRGDFSVVIRSIFKWDVEGQPNSSQHSMRDEWQIGAGGAVTSLSTEEGEWEEMKTKVMSTMGLFTGTQPI